MSMMEEIEAAVQEGLKPLHLQVLNESHGHRVAPGSETHFRVIVVSEAFEGRPKVARHRAVYGLLQGPLSRGVHALAIEALSPGEWASMEGPRLTAPPCKGGDGATRAVPRIS